MTNSRSVQSFVADMNYLFETFFQDLQYELFERNVLCYDRDYDHLFCRINYSLADFVWDILNNIDLIEAMLRTFSDEYLKLFENFVLQKNEFESVRKIN